MGLFVNKDGLGKVRMKRKKDGCQVGNLSIKLFY